MPHTSPKARLRREPKLTNCEGPRELHNIRLLRIYTSRLLVLCQSATAMWLLICRTGLIGVAHHFTARQMCILSGAVALSQRESIGRWSAPALGAVATMCDSKRRPRMPCVPRRFSSCVLRHPRVSSAPNHHGHRRAASLLQRCEMS